MRCRRPKHSVKYWIHGIEVVVCSTLSRDLLRTALHTVLARRTVLRTAEYGSEYTRMQAVLATFYRIFCKRTMSYQTILRQYGRYGKPYWTIAVMYSVPQVKVRSTV